jgi:hypothetical protein
MSASDLVRFGFSRAGGASVLSPKVSDEMLTSSVDSGGGKRYGLGWQLWEAGGYDFVGHGGGMPGVSTRLVIVPAEQIVIAVLCNQSSAGVHELPDLVVERLLESLLPGFTAPPEDEESMPAPDGLDGVWSGEIATYAGNVPGRLKVNDRAAVAVSIAGSAFAQQMSGEAHRLSFPEPDLVAHVPLQLPVPDATVRSPHLLLNLYRDGDRLTGSALAGPDLGADSRAGRLGNGYSYWCELTRET